MDFLERPNASIRKKMFFQKTLLLPKMRLLCMFFLLQISKKSQLESVVTGQVINLSSTDTITQFEFDSHNCLGLT